MNELSTHVHHSNVVKLNLQQTYSDLSDADSELSKYILTADLTYRKRMMEYQETINTSLRELKSLTAGYARQARMVLTLDSLIRLRFDLMHAELEKVDKNYTAIAVAITDCNAQIVSTINVLKDNEAAALVEKEEAVRRIQSWTPAMIFALQILVFIFLVFAYVKSQRDLKVKQALQKELEHQVYFIKAILDNSVDLVVVVDVESRLIVANKRARELLGITDAMVGSDIFSFFPGAENSKTHTAILQARKGEYVHIVKHKAVSIDRTLESFFIPLYHENTVTAVIVIHHDISELVKASEELEKNNEKLQQINVNLEQFAYAASHDLQEPLRKIVTYAEFAARAREDVDKLSGYLSKISNAAERMSKLIKDLLYFARSTSTSSEVEWVDLNIVYRQVIQDLELLVEEKQALVTSEMLPTIKGHAQQLSQVFFNLIHNALKFSDRQPVVTIRCKAENAYYVISFSDNGVGFDPRYKDQIFEVFRRIPNGQVYSGTGIGLAVCKRIVMNHNGSIDVQSALGEGTTFYIRLPMTPLYKHASVDGVLG